MFFRVPAHADVADRRRHQRPLGAFERAEHDFNGELAAILAPGGQFNAGADLLGQSFGGRAGAVGDQPFGEALGNDVLDFLSHQFVAAVAKLFLRLHVQQNDVAALVDHHHGVGSGFEQPAIAAFHLRQMFFRVPAHADVADRRRHQRPFGAFERAEHDFDGELAAILAPRGEFNAGADLLGQSFGRASGCRRRSAVRRSPGE